VNGSPLRATLALAAVALFAGVLAGDAVAASSDWQSLAGGAGSGRPLVASAFNGKQYALYPATGIFRSFDPVANSWASRASHAGQGAGIAGGASIYLFGGRGSTTPAIDSVAAYDPGSNSWAARASMPVPVWAPAAALGPDGRYYVIGGRDNDTGPSCDLNGGCFYDGVQIYDPATNSWSLGSSGPSSVSVFEMDAVSPGDGWIYVPSAGEAYHPATDTWKQTSLPPHNDFSFAPTADGQIVGFWATAIGTTRDDVVNVYSTATDRWTDGTPRAQGVTTASAALAADGRVILIGEGYTTPAVTRAFHDTSTPTGSFTINSGALSTSSTSVSIHSSPVDTSGIATIRVANSGGVSGGLLSAGQNLAYSADVPWQLDGGSDGAKTVWVQWLDPFGHWSAPVSHAITLTRGVLFTKPPTPTLPAGATISDTASPIKLSWMATDLNAIVGYRIEQSVDGAAYVGLFNGNATSTRPKLPFGHTYVERATATDVTNATGTSIGPQFAVALVQQGAASLAGPWQAQSGAIFSGGDDVSCSSASCTATYVFTGRAIGWASLVGPAEGAAHVSVDGGAATTVDAYAASQAGRRLVYSHNWTASASHTITITCLATAGRPRIDLDGFVVVS
jgi:hypothetical protein